MQQDQIRLRLTKFTDLLIDGTIDKAAFGERRDTLVLEQARIKERLAEIERNPASAAAAFEKTVELTRSPSMLYKAASPEKERELLKTPLSNLAVSGKNVEVTLALSFRLIGEREKMSASSPHKGVHRTWDGILRQLLEHFKGELAPAN